jgi:uncharacterized protein YdaU (DUF1376 family)
MSESGVDEWMPLHMGWWLKATQDWDTAWMGPVQLVLMKMWQEGFQTAEGQENEARLAKAARLSLGKWRAIRVAVGTFFTVRDGILTQEFLEAKYKAALGRSKTFRVRNSTNAKKGWETRKARSQSHPNGKAIGVPNGYANGNANGMPMARDRASSSLDLGSDLEREEETIATAVPIEASDPRVLAAVDAYPTVRWVDGEAVPVKIGIHAAEDVAEFMNQNPGYPLLWVVKWYAKREKRPEDLRNFLEDPPSHHMWKNSWKADPESQSWRLAGRA